MIPSSEIDRALRAIVEHVSTSGSGRDTGPRIQYFVDANELDLQTAATLYRIASGEATDLARSTGAT